MRRLAAFGVALVLVLVFGVGQLVLPGIAASTLRDRLSRSGRVLSVQVSAFPAIELLWHDADRVVIRMASYHASTGRLSSLLAESSGVGSLRASAQVLTSGLLTLRNAALVKRGDQLYGSAQIEESDLRAAIPFLQSVTYAGSGGGGVTLQGTADVLGARATVPATVKPVNGRLVVVPQLPLLGGIASVTVFSNPLVRVESVSGGAVPGGLSVSARARLQ